MLEYVQFPPVTIADEHGLIGSGGDLSVDTLVSAYQQGIFPWFNQDQPILWWSPDPRMVLYPDKVKISRSLRKTIKQKKFTVTCNQSFNEVILECSNKRNNQNETDTWICEEMVTAYNTLHQEGYAHSIEVWRKQELVGGLYGIALGDVFFGESMFSRANDASKVALVNLCEFLHNQNFKVIDCQVANDHLISLGAEEIPRDIFIAYLQNLDIQIPISKFSRSFEQAML